MYVGSELDWTANVVLQSLLPQCKYVNGATLASLVRRDGDRDFPNSATQAAALVPTHSCDGSAVILDN